MTNLTRNSPREFHGSPPDGSVLALPASANTRYWDGAALMKDATTGALISCTPTASGKFAGICIEEKDNRTGSPYGGTAGSTTVQVQTRGPVWLDVANASNWARGDELTVHASDDNTFTTDAGTNNIVIGKSCLIPESVIGAATGRVLVAIEGSAMRSI